MSSKEQYQDYVKSLKNTITELKKENAQILKENQKLFLYNKKLNNSLDMLVSKKVKWYKNIFNFLKK